METRDYGFAVIIAQMKSKALAVFGQGFALSNDFAQHEFGAAVQ